MAGYDKDDGIHQINNLFFVHNCFGSMFSGILNWFADEFYPRFNYKVIGTYDKSVEFFKKKKEYGGTQSEALLPSITLDPMLDFSNAEQGGKFLWQYARYAPTMGLRLWKSIDLKEQDLLVTPVFSRYQGNFEITFWLSSVYELMDFRVALLQFCGGFQRWCRPEFFWSYLMLPDAVANYTKEDGYNIDWGNTYSDVVHVQTINKHRRVVPITMDPMWRLESFADASTKYGGDTIAEYKLSATFAYEVNLPTYIAVSEHIDPKLSFSMSLGETYTKYPMVSPYKVLAAIKELDNVDKYFEENFNFFKITDPIEERDARILEFGEDSFSYPVKIVDWNYICSGELKYVNAAFLADSTKKVVRGDIVLIDEYDEDYLPHIRKAEAVISASDTSSSRFYAKCKILKKSCICNLTDEEKATLIEYVGDTVTVDARRKRIYSGTLDVTVSDETDPISCFRVIEEVKEEDRDLYNAAVKKARDGNFPYDLPMHRAIEYVDRMSKRLVSSFTDGVQRTFPLEYTLDAATSEGLLIYVNDELVRQGTHYTIVNNDTIKFADAPERGSTIYIGGELLVIKESKLVGFYQFTQDDIDEYSTDDYITIDLPSDETIDRLESIVLVSYTGKLEYDRDYTIDLENMTALIKVEPLESEIVQIFYYVDK